MITKNNLKSMLNIIGFSKIPNDKFEKYYPFSDCSVIVDFRSEKIIYPEDKGFKINVATTTNFSEPENFVVLECVSRLLDKGYRPENIELERTWILGHEQKVGEQIFAYLIKMVKCCLLWNAKHLVLNITKK